MGPWFLDDPEWILRDLDVCWDGFWMVFDGFGRILDGRWMDL